MNPKRVDHASRPTADGYNPAPFDGEGKPRSEYALRLWRKVRKMGIGRRDGRRNGVG